MNIFYYTKCIEKYVSRILNVILHTPVLIHSFSVLIWML